MKYFLKTLLFLLILAYVHPAEATIPDSLKSRIANTIAEFETTGLALKPLVTKTRIKTKSSRPTIYLILPVVPKLLPVQQFLN